MFLCLSGPGDNVPRDIRAMRCEIDIKKFAYASAEGGGAPVASVPRSATAIAIAADFASRTETRRNAFGHFCE